MATKPLAIDLFCGLFGWSAGLVEEGWDVVGFDIEDMHAKFGIARRPEFVLVLQDVLSLHGSQFRNAALIVASPPCQAYSYRAMPWKKAKALPPPDNSLFEALFRIQREACEASDRNIPLIVENVRGAQKYIGRARWNWGSFYLWGDVPALMPTAVQRYREEFKTSGHINQRAGHPHKRHLTNPREHVAEGRKGAGAGAEWFDQNLCRLSSKSDSRKAASAMIAKIPTPLSRYIGRHFHPRNNPNVD